jgi:hypothetical protein
VNRIVVGETLVTQRYVLCEQVDPSLAANRIVVGETLVTQRYVLCEQVDP